MAIDLSSYNPVPFTGSKVGRDISLCRNSQYPPKVIPVTIDWTQYPSRAVSFNLQAGGGAGGVINPLDIINSVYVDNSNSFDQVFVVFQDTGHQIVVNANSIIYAPVETNQLNVTVCLGFTNNITNQETTLLFSNVMLPPAIFSTFDTAVEFIEYSGIRLFGPRAAGDLLSIVTLPLTSAGNTPTVPPFIFQTPRINGSIIVTDIEARLFGAYNPTSALATGMSVSLQDNTGAIYWAWQFYVGPDVDNFGSSGSLIISSKHGLNMNLDATHQYFYNNAVAIPAGFLQIDMQYTWAGT